MKRSPEEEGAVVFWLERFFLYLFTGAFFVWTSIYMYSLVSLGPLDARLWTLMYYRFGLWGVLSQVGYLGIVALNAWELFITPVKVSFDDEGVQILRFARRGLSIPWADVASVDIVPSERSPYVVFIVTRFAGTKQIKFGVYIDSRIERLVDLKTSKLDG